MAKRLLHVLLSLILVITAFGSFTDYQVKADEISIGPDVEFVVGDTVDFGADEVFVCTDDGTVEERSVDRVSGKLHLDSAELDDNGQYCLNWSGEDEMVFCIAAEETGTLTGFKVSGGDGTEENPYTFEVLFEDTDVIPVTGIELSRSEAEILENDQITLSANVLPENATDRTVEWESEDDDVAVVINGVVTAIGKGTTIITASSKSNPDVTAECKVKVVEEGSQDIGIGTTWYISELIDLTGYWFVPGGIFETGFRGKSSSYVPKPYYYEDEEEWGFLVQINTGQTGVNQRVDIYIPAPEDKQSEAFKPTGFMISEGDGSEENPFRFETVYDPIPEIKVENLSFEEESIELETNQVSWVSVEITPQWATNTSVKWSVVQDHNVIKLYYDHECTREVGTEATEEDSLWVKAFSPGDAIIRAESGENSSIRSVCDVMVTGDPVTYKAEIAKDIKNGSVTFPNLQTEFEEGEVVTVNAGPDKGYTLKSLKYSIKGKDSETEITEKGADDYTYLFKMPAGDVTITAVFEKAPAPDPKPAPDVETIDMYRMYNPNSGEHFYTGNVAEKNHLISVGWNYEGVGFKAPKTSNTPMYRLYNPNAGDHHYTYNKAERDHLVSVGWNDEGIGWYADDNKGVPQYRLYNPNAEAGAHHYTWNTAERDHLISLGWKGEGIGFYSCR